MSEELEVDVQEENEVEQQDFSSFSIVELINELDRLLKGSIKEVADDLAAIKQAFDEKYREIKRAAFKKFTEEGGLKDDFEFRGDESFKKFDEKYSRLRATLKEYHAELKVTLQQNLKRKEALLDELREIVSADETENSFKKVKEIQQAWNDIKQLPKDASNELWSNYKGLLDIYYNNRGIYFDLKNLDRKKNLELKKELCAKVEALLGEENIAKASEELNQLHNEYKNIGPVPEEDNETVWAEFKALTEKFHDKRKAFFETFKAKLDSNAELKKQLVERAEAFTAVVSESIDDWKNWSKELESIQEEWKKIGQVPNAIVKDLNKSFWDTTKQFYENKRKFFKQLDEVRKINLSKKNELIQAVTEILEQEYEDAQVPKIIDIQNKWKKVGPVPKAQNEKVYQKFKALCDTFFDRKRGIIKQSEEEQVENLKQKNSLIDQIKKVTDADALNQAIVAWNEIGLVPKDELKKLQDSFKSACDAVLDKLALNKEEEARVKLEIEVGGLKGHPNAKKLIANKVSKLNAEINEFKNEIEVLNNNKFFFQNSKNADQIFAEVDEKVEVLNQKIGGLKKRLKILKSF